MTYRLGHRQRRLLGRLEDGYRLQFQPHRSGVLPARLAFRPGDNPVGFVTIDKRVPESLYEKGLIWQDSDGRWRPHAGWRAIT